LNLPCSLSLIKILFPQIFIDLRSISFWIKIHLSLRSSDSMCRSSGFMSGLICIPLGRALVLDRRMDTSIALLNFIKIGRGRLDCSWYLPSLWRSRIDRGLMFSLTLVIISMTLLKSRPDYSFLGAPFSHSSIPCIAMLNFRSCCKFWVLIMEGWSISAVLELFSSVTLGLEVNFDSSSCSLSSSSDCLSWISRDKETLGQHDLQKNIILGEHPPRILYSSSVIPVQCTHIHIEYCLFQHFCCMKYIK